MSHSEALQQIEEREYGNRQLNKTGQRTLYLIAALWSLFQLLVADLWLLDSLFIRSIHLAFALTLVLAAFAPSPSLKKTIPWLELLFIALGALSALYLALFYDEIAARQGRATTLDVCVGVALIITLLEAARRCLGPSLPSIASLFILSTLFASSLPSFLASKDVPLSHLLSKLTLSTEGIYGIPLRISADTIFLFVLFGAMLEIFGAGEFFVQLAYSLLGRFTGGPAKAAVLASGATGLISGSSIANTVTTGTFTIPLMKRYGYPAEKAGAIEVAASTNGQLMPPVMGAAAFIIAEYCDMPYLAVVRAALIPALISYCALLFIVHLEAHKLNLKPVDSSALPNPLQLLKEGWHYFIPLLFLLYMLVVLRQSPARSAYYAILSLIAVEATVQWLHSSLSSMGRLIWKSLVTGGMNMMSIAVAVATAGIIVGVVTTGLGGKISTVIQLLSRGYFLPLLLITAFVSLLLGMGLPTTANYIVMATLTVPAIVASSSQLDLAVPLISAHLFCFYFGILADDTPPVGLAAYAASAIAQSNPLKTAIQGFVYDLRTAILPFMFIFNEKLLLIGVNGWGEMIWIFTTSLLAMCAFSAAIQSYLVRHNSWFDSLILLLSAVCLLQPSLIAISLSLTSPLIVSSIGIGLFALVLIQQVGKKKAMES